MTTLYATHPDYTQHYLPHHDHPERPQRIEAVWQALRHANLPTRLQALTPPPARDEQLRSVHDVAHLQRLQMISQQSQLTMYDHDTYVLPDSLRIARLAVGGVTQTIDAIHAGDARNGIVAVRPPGHHATPARAMGFCLLNNIAIGARYAQTLGMARVLIVDYDVHHGNGTQDTFYADDSVLFISTHQHPFYPGTGDINATGTGDGTGYTLNIPLSAGHGDANYERIFDDIVWKAARRYLPDLILVSAGFDAHYVDPLAMMRLSLIGYARITRQLKAMADELCDGKIVFVMEGGYDLRAVSHGMRNIAHVLLDEDTISDPYGLDQRQEPDVAPLIDRIQRLHAL
jgi:acetoin utilization deacetylase AcuC-like enzyme